MQLYGCESVNTIDIRLSYIALTFGGDFPWRTRQDGASPVSTSGRTHEALDFLQSLHVMHAGDLADSVHDFLQVFQVGDFQDYVYAGLAVLAAGFYVAGVGVGVADNGGGLFLYVEAVGAARRGFLW